jgi:hypothetical protein
MRVLLTQCASLHIIHAVRNPKPADKRAAERKARIEDMRQQRRAERDKKRQARQPR